MPYYPKPSSGGSTTAPLVTKYTSGSGTHTLTGSPLYILVEMVGGGGGGSGSGTASGTAATDGGNTTFGSSLLVANGGTHGIWGSTAGAGGTASLGSGPVGIALTGGHGQGWSEQVSVTTSVPSGGDGGNSAFGGAGGGGEATSGGYNAATNSGSGGGGGGSSNSANNVSGSGGGAGGYVKAIITSPSASYSYAVGAAGGAGAAGTSGSAGGNGAAGIIIVTEYYQ